MLDAQLLQHADDDLADLVARAIGRLKRCQQEVEAALSIALVKRLERFAQIWLLGLLQPDASTKAIGGEATGHPA